MKTFLQKLLLRFGLTIHHFPTADRIFHDLENKEISVVAYMLRQYSENIKQVNAHKKYNRFLVRFIPSNTLSLSHAKFFGKGFSAGSLNSFRKIDVGADSYFEKIYFNHHSDFEKVRYFYDHFSKKLQPFLKTPKIKWIFEGDYISAVYFDFVDLHPVEQSDFEYIAIQNATKLYQFSMANAVDSEPIAVNLTNFLTHFVIKRNFETAKVNLAKRGISMDAICDRLENSRKILCHGDLFERNCSTNGYLIDWDAFGIYPIAFDFAFIYYRLLVRKTASVSPLSWLNQHFKAEIDNAEWPEVQYNFAAFLIILAQNPLNESQFSHFYGELIAILEIP